METACRRSSGGRAVLVALGSRHREIEVVVTSNGAGNATYRPALPSMSANTVVERACRALALTVVLMFLVCAEAYAETVSLSCSGTLRVLRVRYRT